MTKVNPGVQSTVNDSQTKLVSDAKAGASKAVLAADVKNILQAQSIATPKSKTADEYERIDKLLKDQNISSDTVQQIDALMSQIKSSVPSGKLKDLVATFSPADLVAPDEASSSDGGTSDSAADDRASESVSSPSLASPSENLTNDTDANSSNVSASNLAGSDVADDSTPPSVQADQQVTGLVGLASHYLAGISSKDEKKGDGALMKSLVSAAAGTDPDAFSSAAKALTDRLPAIIHSARDQGDGVSIQNAQALSQVLGSLQTAYDGGGRLKAQSNQDPFGTGGGASPDPVQDPGAWTTWANQNTQQAIFSSLDPTTGGSLGSTGNVTRLAAADPSVPYQAPGSGQVTTLHAGESQADSTIKKLADLKGSDLNKYVASMASNSNKEPLAPSTNATLSTLKENNWAVFQAPAPANTTILYNKEAGKYQMFDTDTGKKQVQPAFLKSDNSSGTMILRDGTRVDLKGGKDAASRGITIVSGSQLTTTTPLYASATQLMVSGKTDTSPASSSQFTTTSYSDPSVVQAYVSTHSINTNRTAVDVGDAKSTGSHWAWTNGYSEDGTQAWTQVGRNNSGGVGDKQLAFLNDPGDTSRPDATRALYSENAGTTQSYTPPTAGLGWTAEQTGRAKVTSAQIGKEVGIQIGVGLGAIALALIPGLGEVLAPALEAGAQGAAIGAEVATAAATETGATAAATASEAASAATSGATAAGEAATTAATSTGRAIAQSAGNFVRQVGQTVRQAGSAPSRSGTVSAEGTGTEAGMSTGRAIVQTARNFGRQVSQSVRPAATTEEGGMSTAHAIGQTARNLGREVAQTVRSSKIGSAVERGFFGGRALTRGASKSGEDRPPLPARPKVPRAEEDSPPPLPPRPKASNPEEPPPPYTSSDGNS